MPVIKAGLNINSIAFWSCLREYPEREINTLKKKLNKNQTKYIDLLWAFISQSNWPRTPQMNAGGVAFHSAFCTSITFRGVLSRDSNFYSRSSAERTKKWSWSKGKHINKRKETLCSFWSTYEEVYVSADNKKRVRIDFLLLF